MHKSLEIRKKGFILSAVVGIDPGKKGAICLLDDGHPVFWDLSKHDPCQVLYSIKASFGSPYTIVEKQQAMPKQGLTSTFSIGFGYGQIIAALKVLKFPFYEVRAKEWQSGLGLPTSKDKKAHKQAIFRIASQIFPDSEFHGPKGALLDGRSDAAMIADYARRRYAKA